MDFRGLACLLGASVVFAACTTEVADNFDPSTSGTPTTTENPETSNGVTTDADASSSSTSDGDDTTTTTGTSSSSGSDSSSGGFNGSICGDGVIEGNEQCDCGDDGDCTTEELNGLACQDTKDPLVPGVLTGGPLGCNPASCRYDTSQCVYCGDGEINGNEVCELDQPITTSCQKLGKGTAGKLTCMDTCQVDTTACTECGYQFNFEGEQCPGDWTAFRTTGAASDQTWECGDPGAFADGPGVGKTGMWATALNGPYGSNESGYVRSGALDLSNCGDQTITMTIRHWFTFEGSILNSDGGVVQIATENPDVEASWSTIAPNGGTVYVPGVNAAFPPVDNNPAFSGNDPDEGTWVESTFDVTEFSGQSEFYIRFVIGSDSGNERGGWYIDDVEILGSGG